MIPISDDLIELRREVRGLTPDELSRYVTSLDEDQTARLFHTWAIWARDSQLPPPGDWDTWLLIPGRGFGKTRTGSELVNIWATLPNARIALIGKNPKEVRTVMVEGALNGILACAPPWCTPKWNSTRLELVWPNGARAFGYSAETPDALRGPQFHYAWADELAKFKYPDALWDMLSFCMRLGDHPQRLVTTTPRPIKIILDLIKDPGTRVVTGALMENADNLPKAFIQGVLKKYQGTNLGRQEIYGEILLGEEGALWRRSLLDEDRLTADTKTGDSPVIPPIVKVVLGIDPSMTSNEQSDETGMIVAGLGDDGHVYILDDLTGPGSLVRHVPVIHGLLDANKIDLIVAETNNGGDLVEATLRSVPGPDGRPMGNRLPYKGVHAARGKRTRAEPVGLLYEQHRVHHVGALAELEDELVTWTPDSAKSPNRLDALVWAVTELLVDPTPSIRIRRF